MTKQEIANELKELAEHMERIGNAMYQYGMDDGHWLAHATQIYGASRMAKKWVIKILKEVAEESGQ